MSKTVTIFGGGVAGAKLAHNLQNDAQVTLVSPLDYFEIPMAMVRAVVEPDIAARSVVPLRPAQPKVTHVQGRLVSFDASGAKVELVDGTVSSIQSDISVLATGSSYANALIRAQKGAVQDRRAEFAAYGARLVQARNIVIIGGGPIGIELAGEISQDFPSKTVTVIEANADILQGTSRKVAAQARKVLERRGVKFLVGHRFKHAFGQEPQGGIARTDKGQDIAYDLIFSAVGSKPNTDYFPADRLSANGCIPVDDYLRVKGLENTYALGDIADLDEVKKGIYVIDHVKTVTKNIRAQIAGQAPSATYKAQSGNDIMLVTLGRTGGVAHFPGLGMVKSNWLIRMIKSKDMLVGMYRKKIGAKKV